MRRGPLTGTAPRPCLEASRAGRHAWLCNRDASLPGITPELKLASRQAARLMHLDRATAESSVSGRRRAGSYRFAVVGDAAQLDGGFLELRMSLHDPPIAGPDVFCEGTTVVRFRYDSHRRLVVDKTTPKPQSSYRQAAKLRIWQFPLSTTDRSSDNNPASRQTRHVRKGVHYERVHAARHSRMHTNQAPANQSQNGTVAARSEC